MADYCAQCYAAHAFGPPEENDMRAIAHKGGFAWVICEGCGEVVVDHYGFCQGGPGCSGYPFAPTPTPHCPEDVTLTTGEPPTSPALAILRVLIGPGVFLATLLAYVVWRFGQ